METKIKELITKLMVENGDINESLNRGVSEYSHTVKVHRYNHNLEIIKELEKIK
jgi:hypothetical protein